MMIPIDYGRNGGGHMLTHVEAAPEDGLVTGDPSIRMRVGPGEWITIPAESMEQIVTEWRLAQANQRRALVRALSAERQL